jgi:hypothetical protein
MCGAQFFCSRAILLRGEQLSRLGKRYHMFVDDATGIVEGNGFWLWHVKPHQHQDLCWRGQFALDALDADLNDS